MKEGGPALLVLASGSPRRAALLEAAGIPFEAFDPRDDGPIPPGGPRERSLAHARFKAEIGGRNHPDRLVLAADTVVWLDGRGLGKPAGRAEAQAMLRSLAGRRHEVWTGICLLVPRGRIFQRADRAVVAFDSLGEGTLQDYLDLGEWTDKAGAYGIQGAAAAWARVVAGDPETVVGLSTAAVGELLGQARRAGACPLPESG